VIEPGRLVYRGELGSAHTHNHAAVQIAIAATSTVTFTDETGRRAQGSAGLIPAGISHAIDAGAATGLMIYVDSTGVAGRRLTALVSETERNDVRAWIAAAQHITKPDDSVAVAEAAETALEQLIGDHRDPMSIEPSHPSVRRAIDLLPSLLPGPVRLTDVAGAVHLSPDRLGRLFARDVGLSFSAYVRWARLMRAMEVARDGGTLTDAAHAAGFSDSSHANRVTHEMFGIAPIIAQRGVRLG
jgi:AraC-like DNA-binding protein